MWECQRVDINHVLSIIPLCVTHYYPVYSVRKKVVRHLHQACQREGAMQTKRPIREMLSGTGKSTQEVEEAIEGLMRAFHVTTEQELQDRWDGMSEKAEEGEIAKKMEQQRRNAERLESEVNIQISLAIVAFMYQAAIGIFIKAQGWTVEAPWQVWLIVTVISVPVSVLCALLINWVVAAVRRLMDMATPRKFT
jgi:hypothetical protein